MKDIFNLIFTIKVISIIIGIIISMIIILYLYKNNLITPIIESLKDIIKYILESRFNK